MNVKIREANAGDFGKLLKLHLYLYALHQKYDPQLENTVQSAEEWIRKRLSDPMTKIWVLIENSKVVGYLIGEPDRENIWVVAEIYVVSKLRRLGYGKKLVRRALNYCRRIGVEKILTATPEGSEKSRKFWESLSFIEVKGDKKYRYYAYSLD